MVAFDETFEKSVEHIISKDFSALSSDLEEIISQPDPSYDLLEKIFIRLTIEMISIQAQLETIGPDFKQIASKILQYMQGLTEDQNLILAYTARIEFSTGKYDECIEIAMQISNIETNEKSWSLAMQLVGISYFIQGRYQMAILTYERLLDAQDKKKWRTWMNISINLCAALHRTGELSSSYKLLEELLQYTFTSIDDDEEAKHYRSTILFNMALVDFNRKEFEISEKLTLQAIKIDQTSDVPKFSAILHLIRINLELDNLDLAKVYFKLFDNHENSQLSPKYKLAKALILNKEGDFASKAQSLELLNEIIATAKLHDTLLYAYLEKISIMIDEYSLSRTDSKLDRILSEIQLVQKKSIVGVHLHSQLHLVILESRLYIIQKEYDYAIIRLNEGIFIAKEKGITDILSLLEGELTEIKELMDQISSVSDEETQKDHKYLRDYLNTIKDKMTEL